MFLFCLNLLAVCMGYVGIDKLKRHNAHPFHDDQDAGLHTIVYAAKFVSNDVILFWHSPWGSILIWAGAFLLPLIAVFLIFRKERFFTGTLLLLLSFIPFGGIGFLIWFHAYIDLPHEW